MQVKYGKAVNDICATISLQAQYKNHLLMPFERDIEYDWFQNIDVSLQAVRMKMQEICGSKGIVACDDTEFGSIPVSSTEEELDWSSECFVCRFVASYIEEPLALYHHVTESKALEIVKNACDNLSLDEHDMKICKDITQGSSADTLAWEVYQHRIDIDKKKKSPLTIPEHICFKLRHCSIWIDAGVARTIQEDREFEAVYN